MSGLLGGWGGALIEWIPVAAVATGIVAVACLFVERVLRHRIAPRWVAALYGLVFVRLALPMSAWWRPVPEDVATDFDATLLVAADGLGSAAKPVVDAAAAIQATTWATTWAPSLAVMLAVAYLAIALILLARIGVGVVRLRRLVRDAAPWQREGRVDVLVHASAGPLAAGLLRPVIVVPRSTQTLEPAVARLVLGHELAHHRHGDPWLDLGLRFACAVLWPIVPLWVAASRIRHNIELAADAWAMRETGSAAERRAFARALTDYATVSVLEGVGLSSFANLSARVEAIMRGSSRRGWIGWSVAATVPAALCVAVPVDASRAGGVHGSVDATEVELPRADAWRFEAAVPAGAQPRDADDLAACAEGKIEVFNAAQPDDPALLVEAADCFVEAGFWAKATFVVHTLDRKYPDVAHDHVAERYKRLAMQAILDRDLVRRTLWGHRCLDAIDAHGIEAASSTDLIASAECLGKAAFVAAARELHAELDRRSDLTTEQRDHNDTLLAKCDTIIARTRAELTDG